MPDVELLKSGPPNPVAALIFAHGAGALMDSEFMEQMTAQLLKRGCEVIRFEFPYMSARRNTGVKRPPDREVVLLETWKQVLEKVKENAMGKCPVLMGGKSLGGRMASMLVDESGVDGLVCLGYPFHPVAKPTRLRIAHLAQVKTPTLIVQGTRDPLGHYEEVTHYPLSQSINIQWLQDGDHDFKPRVKSGYSQQQHIETAADYVMTFIRQLSSTKKSAE